jgi:hypothetical protein
MSACSVSDDIGIPLTSLQLLSERNISAFVPRLSVNNGMLPVRLKLTGTNNLPGSAAIQVGSSLQDKIQADADQSQMEFCTCCSSSDLPSPSSTSHAKNLLCKQDVETAAMIAC